FVSDENPWVVIKDDQSTKTDDSTAGNDNVIPITNKEITLAQTLIQIKAAKPKVVTTAATTATTTRPKDKGVVVQEPIPLKRKDQIALDEQITRNIQAKLDAELLEEQKLARKQEEDVRIKKYAKDLIRAHAVESRRNLDFLRNDKRRIRVVCNGVVPSKNVVIDKVQGLVVDISGKGKLVNKDAEEDKSGCPWLLYLSKGDKGKWVKKTFKDEHKCLQSRKIKYCTSSFLLKHITDLIILNPQMPIKAIQEQMQKKFHVAISKDKAFRANAKAQVHLRGDVKVQYALLRDYVCELKMCNPDTIVKIDVYGEEDPETPTRMFRRIYVYLGALKRRFKEGGRELLGLDGAFMRGQYPRQMLTEVGVDANNGIYPIAYDRQKGLLPALAKLFPSAEHRYCVRHIYENMNQTWKGSEYKEMLWKCATSPTEVLFQKNMQELKDFNKKTYEWLHKIPPEH
ncbi:hypothetical protein Tco_1462798, partial [Tanacetum coccineum]